MEVFAEVIVPLALKGTLTYRIPEGMQQRATEGVRVMVPLGKSKQYAGIIRRVHRDPPEQFEARPIEKVLDDAPLVTFLHLQFWDWIASYYMCTPGEVLQAAMPHGLKAESRSGEEQPDPGYRPRRISCIGLSAEMDREEKLVNALDQLEKAPAQQSALEQFLRLSGRYLDPPASREVTRKEMTGEGVALHAIQALVKKGILTGYEKRVSRIHSNEQPGELSLPVPLTADQEKAHEEIQEAFKVTPVVLLHGVTSSGKTEIYIHMIQEQIDRGKQVLYLLPEIALTTQIIDRLKRVFGNKVGVYHSRYSDAERTEVYRNLAGMTEKPPYQVILGVRSALFLPFRNPGLFIVDEEHETTYKQMDPAPRYHARDAAAILGLYSGAKLLLGTATPSFESLYNGRRGKYGLVKLESRYGNVALPQIILADTRQARKRKQMKSHFTPQLLEAMDEALSEGNQVILFQNRRGYSNYIQCDTCNHILRCTHCDVSLTYHRYDNKLNCHYCGLQAVMPAVCPECHAPTLVMRGFGTEKIEDELAVFFPGVEVGRLDLDKARTRKAYVELLGDFEAGRTRILVGTQLVTKGLDFGNVSLVGILDADSMLNFPDFRAFERSFQLMTQVSGRAGRREEQGKVVIQTVDPQHPVIRKVLSGDYEGLYREQMEERQLFNYPPYVRLIRITLRHEVPSILDGGAAFLAGELKKLLGDRVLGPQHPLVRRTHGAFIKQVLLKIEKGKSVDKAKQITGEVLDVFSLNPVYKKIRFTVDVDPV